MVKSYELFLHYKQGDDLSQMLEGKTVSEALSFWAEFMRGNALILDELAKRFKDKQIECEADTHYISFSGDEETLEKAAQDDLIHIVEYEDEESESEDDD